MEDSGDGPRGLVLVVDDVEVAAWRLAGPARTDLAVVDALARLQLVARRLGYSIRFCNPTPELCELLELAGLGDVVGR